MGKQLFIDFKHEELRGSMNANYTDRHAKKLIALKA